MCALVYHRRRAPNRDGLEAVDSAVAEQIRCLAIEIVSNLVEGGSLHEKNAIHCYRARAFVFRAAPLGLTTAATSS